MYVELYRDVILERAVVDVVTALDKTSRAFARKHCGNGISGVWKLYCRLYA